jgi:hypothetical protein
MAVFAITEILGFFEGKGPIVRICRRFSGAFQVQKIPGNGGIVG